MAKDKWHLSVNFISSLSLTLLAAFGAITDEKNSSLQFIYKSTDGVGTIDPAEVRLLNLFIYGAPFATMFFYYLFDAFNEADWAQKTGDEIWNIEWYIRLVAQVILALIWYELEHNNLNWFLWLQPAFYICLLVWDAVVVWMSKQKYLEYIVLHDALGLLGTSIYVGLLTWMENAADLGAERIIPVFLLGTVVASMMINVVVLFIRLISKSDRGLVWRLFPPILGGPAVGNRASGPGKAS